MTPDAGPPTPLPPGTSCRAVIDVGTNSVKLLVARVNGTLVEPLVERGIQTRLGEGFFETRRLRPEAIERTATTVAALHEEALAHCPNRLRILATAAARESLNRQDLLEALHRRVGTEVEVISGELEAELAFRGVCSHPRLANTPLLVTDVGGGSTEFIVGQAGQRTLARSFPLGAVRLFERLRPPESPTPDDLRHCRSAVDAFLLTQVLPCLDPLGSRQRPEDASPDPPGPASPGPSASRTDRRSPFANRHSLRYVGVGGTAVILARIAAGMTDYDRERIEATELSAASLTELTERLWFLSLPQRRQVTGLPPERADIILTGIAIYEGIVRVFGLSGMQPCTRGLRFAALMDPA